MKLVLIIGSSQRCSQHDLKTDIGIFEKKNVVIQCKLCGCKESQRTMPLDEWLQGKDRNDSTMYGRLKCREKVGDCEIASLPTEK